ncbi:MAG: beta-eliminating lyase-related protein [Alphaproteobacteria bacterium]|nr:beta-eliminating lyase-related protein [Alphaproteobacteria bacterium]MDP6516229.1 beta-eliminating lyase-related protein [Alphaproteobacteria bacterium]
MNFRSDNEAPVAPEIMRALAEANHGKAASYGADAVTARLKTRFAEVFETEVAVFPVVTGTAANALALAQVTPPYGAVYCHPQAHILVDECGAVPFHAGGAMLWPIEAEDGKLRPDSLGAALAAAGAHGDHQSASAAVSFAQATEAGTTYKTDHIAALAALAHDHGLAVHMDGARLANAIAGLGCAPADITWRAGVDLLSFGATKNGALAAEAVVLFDPARAPGLGRRRMRAGHLLSKMRFVSVQLEAYLTGGLWLRLAGQANRAARRLGTGLAGLPGAALLHPVEANEVFVRLPETLIGALAADGFTFHRWPGIAGAVRLVCAWDTRDDEIDALLEAAAGHAGGRARITSRVTPRVTP